MTTAPLEIVELNTLKQVRITNATKVLFRVSESEVKIFCQYASEIARIPHLELSFQGNYKSLNVNVFSRLPNLKKVGFTKLPVAILNSLCPHLSQIEALKLEYCESNVLPDNFHYLKHLKKLDLQSNYFQSFPEIILDFNRLEFLNLNYNAIQIVPNEISKLSQLIELNLDCCQLVELPQTIGQLKALKRLHLSRNYLTKLPHSLTQCIDLEEITLNNNFVDVETYDGLRGTVPALESLESIAAIPYQLDVAHTCQLLLHLPKLQRIDLSDLILNELPPEYYQFKNLREFRFSSHLWTLENHFKAGVTARHSRQMIINGYIFETEEMLELQQHVPSRDLQRFLLHVLGDGQPMLPQIASFQYLDTLHISNLAHLKTFPDLFQHLPNLQHLTISACPKLTLFPSSIYKSKRIKTLSFTGNGCYLDVSQLKFLPCLQHLSFDIEASTDLEPLSECTELTFLNIESTSDRYELPESFKKLNKLTQFVFTGLRNLNLTQAIAQLPYLEMIRMMHPNILEIIELPKTTRHLYWEAPISISTVLHWVETLPQLETIEIQRFTDIEIPKSIILLNRLKRFCLRSHFNHLNVPLEWVLLDRSKIIMSDSGYWIGFELLNLVTARIQNMALSTEKLQMLAFGLFAGLTNHVKSLLSNPFERFEDLAGFTFYILGKPTWLNPIELEIYFKTNGIKITSEWTTATHILICPENDADDILWTNLLNSGKKLVLEDFLKQKALTINTPFLMTPDNEALTQQITQLLSSTETDNIGLIVAMMNAGGANRTLLSYLMVILLEHPDAEVRESAHILFKKYASLSLQTHVQAHWQERYQKMPFDGLPFSIYYHSDIDFFDAIMADKMIFWHHYNTNLDKRHPILTLYGYVWTPIHTGLSRMPFIEAISLSGVQNFDYQHFIQLISTLSIKSIELRALTAPIDLEPLWTNPNLERLHLSSATKGLPLRIPAILTAPLKYLKLEGFEYLDVQYVSVCLSQIAIVHFEQAPDTNRYLAWNSCIDDLPF